MEDKEIGELWRRSSRRLDPEIDVGNWETISKLIRKLVEERAWKIAANYYRGLPDTGEEKACYKAACRDFDIPLEQFERP